MAIPVYLWLKDDGGADIKGSVDVQDREGSIEVVAQKHNLYIPTDSAHELMATLSAVLLKYEPRLKKITVVLEKQEIPGELHYAIDAELNGVGLVRYGTEFMPEGRVLLRHLKQQQYLDTTTRM